MNKDSVFLRLIKYRFHVMYDEYENLFLDVSAVVVVADIASTSVTRLGDL